MNFDEIQKNWNKQAGESVDIREESLHKTRAITHTILRNSKKEKTLGIIAFLYLLIIPFFENLDEVLVVVYYVVLLQLLAITFISVRKTQNFTKLIKDTSVFDSRQTLQDVYYQLKYSIETQQNLVFIQIPISALIFFILIGKEKATTWILKYFNTIDTFQNDATFFLWNLPMLVLFIGFVTYGANRSIHKLYGKPLAEIKTVLDELDA